MANEANPTSTKQSKLPTWALIVIYGLLALFVALLAWRLIDTTKVVAIGDEVPDFTLTTFDGQQVNLKDLRGKVVLVNVWASWCDPCANEAGFLEESWQYYQPDGKVVFLGINWQDTEFKALEYMQRFQVSYINGPDYSERIGRIFRVTGVPETFIIDQEGRLSAAIRGEFTSVEQIYAEIEPLLRAP